MLCSEWALVKHGSADLTILPLRCKCWSCDLCRPLRHARLVREAQAGKPDLFVTLTSVYKPGRCPHMAARALARAWRVVRREYVTKHGKGSLPFLCVFEATKNGWPHIHIVARCKWLEKRWLRKRMEKLIGAKVVDVRRVRRSKSVARYVAKYIGKETQRFEGVKRYWRSLDYLLPPPDTDEEDADPCEYWTVSRFNWLTEAAYYQSIGYSLDLHRSEAILTKGRSP